MRLRSQRGEINTKAQAVSLFRDSELAKLLSVRAEPADGAP